MDTKSANSEFASYVYFGSNSWLTDYRDFIDKEIVRRQSYKYELFFRVYYPEQQEQQEQQEHKHQHISYIPGPAIADINELKKNAKKIIELPNEDYKELKAFVRRMEDNYTLLVAKKTKGQLLEITENFFKLN